MRRGPGRADSSICGSVVVPSVRAAASLSCLAPETSRAAARLCSIAARISESFSTAMAFSSKAALSADGYRSASRAAASWAAGSALNKVSPPSAPSIVPRRRLLTRIRSSASAFRPGTSAPVRGSMSFVASETRTRPSGALSRRPSFSAVITATARPSPSVPSAVTACSFSAKLSAPRAETRVANSSARAGNAAASKIRRIAASPRTRTLTRFPPGVSTSGASVDEGDTASPGPISPCTWAPCSCRRPRDRSSPRSCLYPRRGKGSKRRP